MVGYKVGAIVECKVEWMVGYKVESIVGYKVGSIVGYKVRSIVGIDVMISGVDQMVKQGKDSNFFRLFDSV